MKLVLEHSGTKEDLKKAYKLQKMLEEDLGNEVEQSIGDVGPLVLYDERLNKICTFKDVPSLNVVRLALIMNCKECEDELD